MGIRNYLVEGVSGTGKTSVCRELQRRGFHAVNGDTDLAYQGDPDTGEPISGAPSHWHHIWSVERVRKLVADRSDEVTFFCGGSRNFTHFLDLFDGVLVLEVDRKTLEQRLDRRGPDEFGGQEEERELVLRLHRTGDDSPRGGTSIDATAPLEAVVDRILEIAHDR